MQNRSTWRKARKWLFRVFLFYCLFGALLYFFQEKILFHPKALSASHNFEFARPFNELNLQVGDSRNLNIIQFTVPDTIRKGIVLYFHGNRRNVERYAPYAEHFRRNNYEVWMADYPGFGKSTGKISEKKLYEDAELLYRMALARIAADSIVVYGKSIGTGVASYLASHVSCRQLILETPYYNIEGLARRYFFIYPVMLMSDYSFPINEYLQTVKSPIRILHGTRDGVIPYSHSVKLKKENPAIELITIEKGRHNNLADFRLFHEKLNEILKK